MLACFGLERWRAGKVSVNPATSLVSKITAADWRAGERNEVPHSYVRANIVL